MAKIECRLRPGKDDDLIKYWDALPVWNDKSDIVRAALRQYFTHGKADIPLADNLTDIVLKAVAEPIDAENKLDDLLGGL